MKNITYKISYSRYSSYLACPYRHYLRYIEGLSLNKPVRPLFFGSDFHKLLELRNRPKELKQAKQDIYDKYYELPPNWQSDLGENYYEDLTTIFHDYNRVYKDAPQPDITEHPFEIPIGKFRGEPVEFIGVIDELYLVDSKTIKIGEHKTFNRTPNMNNLIMNTQKCLYAKAIQIKRGVLPSSVIWDYIKSTPASEPIWLEKSKRFSQSKSKTITPYSWVRACKKKGIKDKEVIRQGRAYKENITNFFFRADLDLVPQMVENIWESFLYTCKHIVKFGDTNKTMNITRDCEFCNFRDICFSECTGGNTKYIIEKNYTRKQHNK